jgi:hypothetical protein
LLLLLHCITGCISLTQYNACSLHAVFLFGHFWKEK